MATASQQPSTPASAGSPMFHIDEPEEVIHHLVIEDPEEAQAWGYIPGVAMCGFIFTGKSSDGISNASLVVGEDCRPCHEAFLLMQLEHAMEQGL